MSQPTSWPKLSRAYNRAIGAIGLEVIALKRACVFFHKSKIVIANSGFARFFLLSASPT